MDTRATPVRRRRAGRSAADDLASLFRERDRLVVDVAGDATAAAWPGVPRGKLARWRDGAEQPENPHRQNADRFRLRDLACPARRCRLAWGTALTRHLARVASATGENVLPAQAVRANQRAAGMRARLLSTGYVTYATLANRRGGTVDAARAFVARERAANRVFTVKHEARTLIPALLFDEDGRVTAVSRAVEFLRPIGVDGWALWGWLATPSGWLSGQVPAKILIRDPGRGLAAVRAYATPYLLDAGYAA